MADWYDVLIVGGGFGGAFCAHRLERLLPGRSERVLPVAPEKFPLVSPLPPEAASGPLEPRHAVIPLRELLRRTHVLTGRVDGLDVAGRRAAVIDLNGERHDIGFSTLVMAPGAVPTTLPIPGLAEQA